MFVLITEMKFYSYIQNEKKSEVSKGGNEELNIQVFYSPSVKNWKETSHLLARIRINEPETGKPRVEILKADKEASFQWDEAEL